MPLLFEEYELLARSGLFDAKYYLGANPDVARSNLDPLMHYVESGCRERRNPNPDFDTSHYLSQCQTAGETPDNALFHYVTVGSGRGFTTHPRQEAAVRSPQSSAMLFVDIPRIVNGAADAPVRGGLSIVGWGIAAGSQAEIVILLDDERVTRARLGLRRPDVAAIHSSVDGAMTSGFAAHLPPKALAVGKHRIAVAMSVGGREISRVEFGVEVQEIADDRGPWVLRRKMSRAEVDVQLDILKRLDRRPFFQVLLPVSDALDNVMTDVRKTIEALSRQEYANWALELIPLAPSSTANALQKALRDLLEDPLTDVPQRIVINHSKSGDNSVVDDSRTITADERYVVTIKPGDRLGCDALLEFAVAASLNPKADFLYSDDRRMSGAEGKVEAFFKPDWSPDFLLSCNYIGRAWSVRVGVLERLGLPAAKLAALSDYDAVLRLTESSEHIHHVPKVLYEQHDSIDTLARERQALVAALKRRGCAAQVEPGRVKGHHRVRRSHSGGKVSIVIPTCAADGLIRTCLETLRSRTAYRDYEIICVENIPPEERQWKRWLVKHANTVIEAKDGFNWSTYNNRGAARASGRYLLFLNDDVEITDPDWLDALVEHGQRPEVGVVGPQLLYPDGSVQHAGVMLDAVGRGRHAFRHLGGEEPGYFGLALSQRNVISVTGACLMTRREVFEKLEGFDEDHSVINNDLDYCLRSWSRGLFNIFTPHARLVHHELVSRKHIEERYDADKFTARWSRVIAVGDPYFNPNLSRDSERFTIEREPLDLIYAGHPLFARDSVRRILVVKLDHIGDCITALPALRRLKQHFPSARITVLSGRSTLPIWTQEPAVDEAWEFNFFHARSGLGKVEITTADTETLAEKLRAGRFDLAIDLRKQPDTRQILHLSGARWLAGFNHQGRFPWLDIALEWDEDVPLRGKQGHVSDDLLALVEAVSIKSMTERGTVPVPAERTLSLPKAEQKRLFAKPYVCVHPAAGSPMRQWPVKNYSQLIDLLVGVQSYNVAVIGGPDEASLAAEVIEGSESRKEVINLVGKFKLDELPYVLSRAALFVGNNSGPQHIAAGLGVPTLGIHSGVVDAREWGPLGEKSAAIRLDMSCSPCFIEHAKDCSRGVACLNGLTVGQVFKACTRFLAASGI